MRQNKRDNPGESIVFVQAHTQLLHRWVATWSRSPPSAPPGNRWGAPEGAGHMGVLASEEETHPVPVDNRAHTSYGLGPDEEEEGKCPPVGGNKQRCNLHESPAHCSICSVPWPKDA